MGAALPSVCDSAIIERQGTKSFDVAVTELNGWRTDMEDAHLIYVTDDVGVFGVYDGHGGKDCSKFAAQRIQAELEKNGVPEDDAAWEDLFIQVDQEFLASDMSSGTTATMCVVRKPEKAGEKHKLHVINAGDSRVVLGKANGRIVNGGGTDKGLTRDHKPEDPDERKRILKAGATVENDRVNGSLSVSRGFGDRDQKQTGGPGPDNRPVTCIPEQFDFECDETDFVLLVCDGVSEGNFSNEEVVQLVAKTLKGGKEGGHAARLVCLEAINKDSKDNITCMIVQLQGVSDIFDRFMEFIPGSVSKITNAGFRKAYAFMAAKAKLSLAQAIAKRYEVLQEELKAAPGDSKLKEEAEMLGSPPGTADSDERLKWAEQWLADHPEESGGGDGPGGTDMDALLNMLGKGGGKGGGLDAEARAALQNIIGGKGGKGRGRGKGRGKGAPQADSGWFASCCRRRPTQTGPRNLLAPEVGDTVIVDGLKGAPELNGSRGKILRFIEDSDRFEVQVEGVEGVKALKAANLRLT